MNRKTLSLALAVAAVAGCNKSAANAIPIQTATIERRDVIVDAEATGIIEPINVIEVKSKTASGQVIKMPVEIGTHVRPGDLIVQIDTTDLHTRYEQALADQAASTANFKVAQTQLNRQQMLFAERIITQPELEQAQTGFASAQASKLRNDAVVALAAQGLKDATVVASVVGTIITKPVSLGQVIQAGGGSVSGGTVIATMADLTKVRARALVNETDIGAVQPGQTTTVAVDAFPNHEFLGAVEKIEPMATVQQNVTMFPVLISLDNSEGLLKPGMNGEAQIRTDARFDVIAVPNDAIRSPREAAQAASLLGLSPESVAVQMRGGSGGNGPGGGRGVQVQINRGELDPSLQGGERQAGGRQGGGRGGRGGRGGIQVSDADCQKVTDATKAKPAVSKKIDDLRAKMREPDAERQTLMGEMGGLYRELGVDMMVANSCNRRAAGGARPGGAGNQQAGGARGQGGGGNGRTTMRTGLVFVKTPTSWEAKTVRLGVANYDYTEVLGDVLKEGDQVALLSAAALQQSRQAQMDRQKANASPFGNPAQPGRGGPGGGPGGGGGGGRQGGGGGRGQ